MINNFSYGMPRSVCLHCMKAYVEGDRCPHCGKPNTDEGRPPNLLPFGYLLQTPQRRWYMIGEILGKGGFGVTYLAWDMQFKRPVALKELFPDRLSRDPSSMTVRVTPDQQNMFQYYKRRFVEEARVISSLRNEAEIINIYDCFLANGTGYYAMEYLDGMDMQHWLIRRGKPFTWSELESPVRQILKGLSILHGYGLLHRDISPDNIFLCKDGRVKLIDFGSVRSVNADHFTTILKRIYAPPELFLVKGNQGFWTDTYSLCGTLYYLLSGRQPLLVHDRVAMIATKGEDPLTPLSQLSPTVPAYVANAVMHGMLLDESKRFRNTAEMRRAFFPEKAREVPTRGTALMCINGAFAGRTFPFPAGTYISLGRGGSNIIAYPTNSPTVSRRHCVFYTHISGKLFVQDQHSSNGTYLDLRRIEPMKWYEVKPGQKILVGGDTYIWKGIIMNGGTQ